MRILCLDHWGGDGLLDFVLRCQHAGHDVKFHFHRTDRNRDIGKGLITYVDDWRQWMRWADLVVLADNTHYLRDLEPYRREGCKIVGATQASAEWELKRKTGMDIFKKAGIDIPVYKEFTDYDSAIKFVTKEHRGFVAKPCYDETDKNLTYLGKTPEAMVTMLERWKKAGKLKGPFILQELVDGTEMAVGGWIGPGGFNAGWCENWEEKKLFPGGLGPATGEMGTVVRYVAKSKLADKVLKPLEALIEETGHVGYVDVNCIVDAEGTPWPLEFTCRNGYPTFNIQLDLHEGDCAEWLLDLAEGRDSRNVKLDTVAVGVVMAQGDFPFSKLAISEVQGFPIYGLDKVSEHVHLAQVMAGEAWHDVGGSLVKGPCVVTAGDYVLIACGLGDTITQARKAAYRTMGKLKLSNGAFWRVDIGERLKRELKPLQANGFAVGLEY